MDWNPENWKKKKALQQPEYPDRQEYEKNLSQIRRLPPLVFPGEIENLKSNIADAGRGKRFILQGGDCVERFADCSAETITNKVKILLQMSVILTYALRKPVVRIGRIAGQFAKPRSSATEAVSEDREVPTYRGDSINGFDAGDRTPDPARLLRSYFFAAAALNYIRAMIDGGFADLHHPYNWNLHAMEETGKWNEYKEIIERILDAIHFMESFGGLNAEKLDKVDFFISHEALHLGYEETLTRMTGEAGKYYNLGAHMLWIGDRTRFADSAHVEYCRGISNPLGIKLGPDTDPEELAGLLAVLNPLEEPGRISLITRLGADHVDSRLPPLIDAVSKSGSPVAWICDPMHGNTTVTKGSLKTRNFQDIMEELRRTFAVHRSSGTSPAGVHFELTGDNVTECTGGAGNLRDEDLISNYQTYCDPRLNYAQSMEIAFLISSLYK